MCIYVKSSHGRSLRWRKHAFSSLVPEFVFSETFEESARKALGYEPEALPDHQQPPNPTRVIPSREGFHWQCDFPKVILQYVWRRRAVATEIDYPPTRYRAWKSWLGCEMIDIIPCDENGEYAGETVRVSMPSDIGDTAAIQFTPDGRGNVEVWTHLEALKSCRVDIMQFYGPERWGQPLFVDQIGDGLTLAIPQFQGAFVVVDDGHVEEAQLFGRGQLRNSTAADYEQIARQHHYRPRLVNPGEMDLWPLWVREQLIEPVAHFSAQATEISDLEPEIGIRTIMRQVIFGPYFRPDFDDWKPELTIEEFAARQWPRLAPLLSAGFDGGTMNAAFSLRDSEKLDEAIEWAAGRRDALGPCIRMIRIRSRQRELWFLPHGPTREAVQTLGLALAAVSEGSTKGENWVLESWADAQRACLDEFHVSLDDLTEHATQDKTGLWELQRAESLLGRHPGESIAESFYNLAMALEQLSDFEGGLVERCRTHRLLTNPDFDRDYQAKIADLQDSLIRARNAVPLSIRNDYAERFQKFSERCEAVATARALAVGLMDISIRDEIRRDLTDRANRAGMNPNACVPSRNLALRDFIDRAIELAAACNVKR